MIAERSATPITAAQRKEAILERRAARVALASAEREEQEAIDLEAIEALEAEHGYTLNIDNRVTHHTPGVPVIVGIRPPSADEYKRFFQSINRANGNADVRMKAINELANTCWAYPQDAKHRSAMIAANGALIASVSTVANKLAELKQDEAGKD